MERKRATGLVRECLERVVAGEGRAGLVHELWLFGSYLRGARAPRDLDVIAFFDPDHDYRERLVQYLLAPSSGDPRRPIATAVAGGRRLIHVEPIDGPARPLRDAFGQTMPLWKRGESVETALARAEVISEDANAGRAARDEHPALEGLHRWIGPGITTLTKLLRKPGVVVERLELQDRQPANDAYTIRRGWKEDALDATTAVARARRAGISHLEELGYGPALWEGGCPVYFDAGRPGIPWWITGDPVAREPRAWLWVVNGSAKREPLHALWVTRDGTPEPPDQTGPLDIQVIVRQGGVTPSSMFGRASVAPLASWLAATVPGARRHEAWIHANIWRLQAVVRFTVADPQKLLEESRRRWPGMPLHEPGAALVAHLYADGPPPPPADWSSMRVVFAATGTLTEVLWPDGLGVMLEARELAA